MSLLRKGAVFVARELARAVTADAGRELGLAVGQRLDPEGAKYRTGADGAESESKSKEQK